MKNKRSINIAAVGDITLGDHPVCFGHGVRSTIDQQGVDFLFKNVSQEFNNQDIVFGNLENVLSAKEDDPMLINTQEFRGKISYAPHLAKAGFNVLSIANNHSMQYGIDSFQITRDSLTNNKITPIGISNSGFSNVFYYRNEDVSTAFIAYSMRPEKYYSDNIQYANSGMDRIVSQIMELKADNHIVIVSLHWGEEFMSYPSYDQVQQAHRLVDAGASLIIGHHPHVLQGIEKYKHGFIAYSLGNFIADFWQSYARQSIILKCEIYSDGIDKIAYTPIMINHLFQPQLIQKEGEKFARKEIEKLSNLIKFDKESNIDILNDKYQEIANETYSKYRKECYTYFLKNIYRYSFSTISYSFTRFISRRLNPSNIS